MEALQTCESCCPQTLGGVVHKYGGSSLATAQKLKAVAARVAGEWRRGVRIAVVASAMGGATDALIDLARQAGMAEGGDGRELDALLATGEQQSVALLALALQGLGVPAVSFTGAQCGFVTNGNHSRARIESVGSKALLECIASGGVPVVAGFQGLGPDGSVTTLGRGGSDTTAVALAARLGWECEIYTDVPGVFRADPRRLAGAGRLCEITSDEMMELAAAGAGVLETRSVELAAKYGVPLYLGRSLEDKNCGCGGTHIMHMDGRFEAMPVTGLGQKACTLVRAECDKLQALELHGLLAKLDIRADMLTQEAAGAHIAVSFAVSKAEAEKLQKLLQEKNIPCSVRGGLFRLTLVGKGLATHADIGCRAFSALAKAGADCVKSAASEIALSFIVEEEQAEAAALALADEFGLCGAQ